MQGSIFGPAILACQSVFLMSHSDCFVQIHVRKLTRHLFAILWQTNIYQYIYRQRARIQTPGWAPETNRKNAIIMMIWPERKNRWNLGDDLFNIESTQAPKPQNVLSLKQGVLLSIQAIQAHFFKSLQTRQSGPLGQPMKAHAAWPAIEARPVKRPCNEMWIIYQPWVRRGPHS